MFVDSSTLDEVINSVICWYGLKGAGRDTIDPLSDLNKSNFCSPLRNTCTLFLEIHEQWMYYIKKLPSRVRIHRYCFTCVGETRASGTN